MKPGKPVKITSLSLSVALTLFSSMSHGLAAGEGGKSQIVQQLQDDNGRMYDAMVAKDLVSLQMAPSWWERMTASDKKGTHAVSYVTRGIYDFAKQMGWGDVTSFEDTADQSGATADEKQRHIQAMLDGWKNKISVNFVAEPKVCDATSFDLAMRYLTAVGEVLDNNDLVPASGTAHITLIASGTAKDITVTTADGKNFTAIAPVNHEPEDWGSKLTDGFRRLSKNRIK